MEMLVDTSIDIQLPSKFTASISVETLHVESNARNSIEEPIHFTYIFLIGKMLRDPPKKLSCRQPSISCTLPNTPQLTENPDHSFKFEQIPKTVMETLIEIGNM